MLNLVLLSSIGCCECEGAVALILKFSEIAFWYDVELVFDKFSIEFVGSVVTDGVSDVGCDIGGWDAV